MNKKNICIVGLGYVGLPLAVEFAKKYSVVGFDINKKRVNELSNCIDITKEIEEKALLKVVKKEQNSKKGLFITQNLEDIKESNIYIITVPTPIDRHKRPDLTPLFKSSESVGRVLKKGDIVIYESTVYPGATEEECVPILEKFSNLKFNIDFYCGYSPERINPGDKKRTVSKILKVTSGSNQKIAKKIDKLYKSIIKAGTHLAPSIKVAEAAKVIENSQRDINIAFINELAIIFNKLKIDTEEVLKAAGTKWNFLKFTPGLVGGHCIGVDPYYLAHKAKELNYNPQIILSGRRLNDNMGIYVANQLVKLMIKKGHKIKDSKVLVLGVTFKENCPDVRNSKVIDVIYELKEFGCRVDVYDPLANPLDIKYEYNIELLAKDKKLKFKNYDAIFYAVSHNEFKDINITNSKNTVVYDLKSVLDKNRVDARL